MAKQNRTSHPVGASRRELDRLPISSQTQNSHQIASQGMRRQARRRNPSKAAQSLGQKPPRWPWHGWRSPWWWPGKGCCHWQVAGWAPMALPWRPARRWAWLPFPGHAARCRACRLLGGLWRPWAVDCILLWWLLTQVGIGTRTVLWWLIPRSHARPWLRPPPGAPARGYKTSRQDLWNKRSLYRRDLCTKMYQVSMWDLQARPFCTKSWKKRSCQETSCRDLVQRSCMRSLTIILYRDLLQRSCQQISFRDLVQRFCQETSCRDRATCAEIL